MWCLVKHRENFFYLFFCRFARASEHTVNYGFLPPEIRSNSQLTGVVGDAYDTGCKRAVGGERWVALESDFPLCNVVLWRRDGIVVE
jgi:hypothetical protein